MSRLQPLHLTRGDLVVALVIVLLAFLLRVLVIFDRAAYDPIFEFLPPGTDQFYYLNRVYGLEAGLWPRAPFDFQPGVVYYLAAARAISGPSLGGMRLVLAWTGALACGLLIGAGWLLTRRAWGGWLTGLLLAIYPVAIFYATVLLTEGVALFYVALLLFLALWQRERLSIARTLFIGLVVGLLALTRVNLAALWLAWALFLALIVPSRRAFAGHVALSLLAAALTIAPATLWNISAGRFQLIAEAGSDQIYRGANRDASGIIERNMAFDLVEDNQYMAMLAFDTARDPLRFVELHLRKFGIFWNPLEPANNVDYVANGLAVSPLLRAIPFDFRVLATLGLLGLAALAFSDRRGALLLGACIGLIFAGVMIVWVASRIRFPIVAPLTLTAAWLFVYLWDRRRALRGVLLRLGPVALILALAFAFGDWAQDHLPRKRPVAALPADLRPLDVVFDDALRLVGWRPLDPWPAPGQGWAEPGRVYAIELFWSMDRAAPVDYEVALSYVVDGARIAGRDHPIGTISTPPLPTGRWSPGAVYAEVIGFRIPPDAPLAQPGAMRLGVYRTEGEFQYTVDDRVVIDVAVTSLPGAPGDIMLQPFAAFDLAALVEAPVSPELTPSDLRFGPLALHGFVIEASVTEAPLRLRLNWESLAEMDADYHLFVHVVDVTDSALAAQYDGPLAALPTSTWPTGYQAQTDLTLAPPPGHYTIYVGTYDPLTGARLPAPAPDDRPALGEIIIHE